MWLVGYWAGILEVADGYLRSSIVAYGLCEIWQHKNAARCYAWISMVCSDGTNGQHTIESQGKYIGWIGKWV